VSLDSTLNLRVVTPQGTVIDQQAAAVAMWTSLGEIQVLRGHAPTMVLLQPGEMRVLDANGAERSFAAGEGFARIDTESVTVFSDMAEDTAQIALDQTEDAKRRAETALAQASNLSTDERDAASLQLQESIVKIRLSLHRKQSAQRRSPAPHQ
jgi:F-type H+-transporting ATPase subunit epsilon